MHAVTDTASCTLERELFLPEEWAHDDGVAPTVRGARRGWTSPQHTSGTGCPLPLNLDRLQGSWTATTFLPLMLDRWGWGQGGGISSRVRARRVIAL
ncbi:hypothetical protein ACWEDZ_39950 [Streptomyces sp. NPDC005047]